MTHTDVIGIRLAQENKPWHLVSGRIHRCDPHGCDKDAAGAGEQTLAPYVAERRRSLSGTVYRGEYTGVIHRDVIRIRLVQENKLWHLISGRIHRSDPQGCDRDTAGAGDLPLAPYIRENTQV